VEDVIVAEDFAFAAWAAMADDVTGLGFSTRDAVNALTLSGLGPGDQSRFPLWLDSLGDHVCTRLLEWAHAKYHIVT
jgi:hypothetical protein